MRDSKNSHPKVAHTPQTERQINFWTAVSAIATCTASIFAGWAAWEAHLSVAESARATQASIWSQMLTEYAAPEMLSSMKNLRNWHQAHPKDFVLDFKTLLLHNNSVDIPTGDSDLVNKLDSDRRRVSHFFNKLRVLSDLGVLNKEDVGATWDSGTYTFLSDVLFPMEQAKDDALLENKSITLSDKMQADTRLKESLKYYDLVLRRQLKPSQ